MKGNSASSAEPHHAVALDDDARELLSEYLGKPELQKVLKGLRVSLQLNGALTLMTDLQVSLPVAPEEGGEDETMLGIAFRIARKRAPLRKALAQVVKPDPQTARLFQLATEMERALIPLVAEYGKSRDLVRRFDMLAERKKATGSYVAEPDKEEVKKEVVSSLEPARDWAFYYRNIRKQEPMAPEPVSPEETQRRRDVLAWGKRNGLHAQTYDALLTLPSIPVLYRRAVTAVIETVTNKAVQHPLTGEFRSMAPTFAEPIGKRIRGISQNLRFPLFGAIETSNLIECGEGCLPELLRTFTPSAEQFEQRIERGLPSLLLRRMRKMYNEPKEEERQEEQHEDSAGRKLRVLRWAVAQGIRAGSFEELFQDARGLQHFWHLAQVTTNEVANLFPPPQEGMDYADYNLHSLIAIQHALRSYDPERDGPFEAFALTRAFHETLSSLAQHATGKNRRVFRDELGLSLEQGVTGKLVGQAARYAKIRNIADSVKVPVTKDEFKKADALERMLHGCSRQERIIVILRDKRKLEFAEISRSTGLNEEHVERIYRAVRDGRKSGRNAPVPEARRERAEPKEEPALRVNLSAEEEAAVIKPVDSRISLDREFGGESAGNVSPLISVLTQEQATKLRPMRHLMFCREMQNAKGGELDALRVQARRKMKERLEQIGYPVPEGSSKDTVYAAVAKAMMTDAVNFFTDLDAWIKDPHLSLEVELPEGFCRQHEENLLVQNVRIILADHFRKRRQLRGNASFLSIGGESADFIRACGEGFFASGTIADPDEEHLSSLQNQQKTSDGWSMVQAGIADLASYRMKLSERPHVILFDHALRNLPEQDARCDQTSAALWALQFVQKNGLVLSLHHDRRPRKGSYGQLLRRSGEERGNMIPLVAEALQEGGRKVGLLHPALQYCAACPRSSSALRRIIAQHLPIGTGEQVYRNLAAQQFLSRNCGTGGQGSVFTHGFTILAAKN